MINPRWVTAHGKQILIETIETPGVDERKRSRSEFIHTPLGWAAEMAKATGTRGAMVWLLLLYMAWRNKSPTFALSNVMLTHYGIGRETKRRILRKLEKAGHIKITRRYKQSPIITLLSTSNIKGLR
jgi:hypothetical protein